jgi:hypothetical protein
MTDLIEVMPFDYQIVESESGCFRVEGVFQRSDVENANKRVYPRSIWERELNEKRISEAVSNRAMFGELDHPADGKTSLKRVAHLITDLSLGEDGQVTGAADILDTPNGQILKTLFESGAQVGISSRGSGSVSNGVVQEDFKLNTFDFVARPSTPGALPRPSGEASDRGTKTEGTEDADALVDVPDVQVTDVFDADLFAKLEQELSALDEESDPESDFNSVAREVISLHNYVSELDSVSAEQRLELSEGILVLSDDLARLATESPEHRTVVTDLLKKVEECRQAVIVQPTVETTKEEPMDDRMQFIKDRLHETSSEAEAEADALRQELEGLSDDELIETALEYGVITEQDLAEDDDVEGDEEVTAQDLYDYAVELEGQLQEAADLVEEMSTQLEEAAHVDDVVLKYEASLGIIQETVARYQLLQEAVGGADKADELMEAHIQKLEAEAGTDNVTEETETNTDHLDEDVNTIEELINEDGTVDDTMVRYKELAESAVDRQGLN